jgi:antitoxin (DNA-binding transcriptional repressor) of toxin-antitoxin stability system
MTGERLTITCSGRPVAELRPLGRRGPDGARLLARWKRVPCVDVDDFRRDLDTVLDPSP